jgi:hypothetical protein
MARRRGRLIGAALAASVASGCAPISRVDYTEADARAALVGNYGGIRSEAAPLGDRFSDPVRLASRSNAQINYLIISGGGAGGAFSVGALKAWSESGKRPSFDVVTGVSTGALIAPYAFLGPAYDDALVHLYTSGGAKWLVAAGRFLNESVLSQEPLRNMIEQYVTEEVRQKIAAEHRKGRRLFVQTTNLDSQRAVVWDMGAIANSGDPGALKLLQDVLIASASVAGAYPAVLMQAHSETKAFNEMHSDGAEASQFLGIPENVMVSVKKSARPTPRPIKIYALINNDLEPEFSVTADNALAVMAEAYAVLVKSQTRSALLALYLYARQSGLHFRFASIDRHFDYTILDPFNTEYMRSVFDLGHSEMAAGTLWRDKPIFPPPELTTSASR